MARLRYEGPGHRVNVAGETHERGDEFTVDDATATRLLADRRLRFVAIEDAPAYERRGGRRRAEREATDPETADDRPADEPADENDTSVGDTLEHGKE